MIKHVQEKVEDHYWEADGLNEELLEQFNINNSSDSESDDTADGDINDDLSTSFGSKSSSLPTSSNEQSSIWCYFICIVYF